MDQSAEPKSQLQGACGLYCGLCPRHQSPSASRCPGCQLGDQHSYCSVWRCAVQKRGYLTCAECTDYPCDKLKRCIGVDADSFISHSPAYPNLDRIRAEGLASHLSGAHERQALLEQLIAEFNDGRSMSFFCIAAALLSPDRLRQAIEELHQSIAAGRVDGGDIKSRAKAIKSTLQELAAQDRISLVLRKAQAGT